jgi:biopolymer transport protein ExbB
VKKHLADISFAALLILTINGCLVYRRKTQCAPEFVEASEKALRQGDLKKFEELARTNRGLLPFICRNMIQDHETSTIADIRSRVEVATMVHINRLRIPIRAMNLISVAAPLLGLLGTVMGMMNTFGALGDGDIAANAGKITGGVGEALIATAVGLAIAITGLLPYNVLNARVEEARHNITDAANALELNLKKEAHGRA